MQDFEQHYAQLEPKLRRPLEDHREIDRELRHLEQLKARRLRDFQDMTAKGRAGSSRNADDLLRECIHGAYGTLSSLKEGNQALAEDLDTLGKLPTLLVTFRAIFGQLAKGPDSRANLADTLAEVLDRAAIIGTFTENNPQAAKRLEIRAEDEAMGGRKKARVYLKASQHTGTLVMRVDRQRGRQLGVVALSLLVGLGILKEEVYTRPGSKRPQTILSLSDYARDVILADPAADLIDQGGYPMVSVPDDWSPTEVGGYYLPTIKEWTRMIKGARRPRSCPSAYHTLNALQKTPWRVNTEVLEVLRGVLADPVLSIKLLNTGRMEVPEMPEELIGLQKDAATEEQRLEYRRWMGARREAHVFNAKSMQASGRVIRAFQEAEELAGEPELYFVWTYDSRGRVYASATGMSPQGSDLQKALLRFAYGSRIMNERQKELWLTDIAQRYGYDKASYADSVKWVEDNREIILACAEDPLNNTHWLDADQPFGFLASCFEYRRYLEDPEGFRSYLPVNLDGACNGSQHCAAILRDEVVAGLTNLRNAPVRSDLYLATAEAARALLGAPDGGPLDYFREHGLPRGLVKRPTMTVAYGCTRYALPYSLYGDYLQSHPVEGHDGYKVAYALVPPVWEAMNQTQRSTMQVLDALTRALGPDQIKPKVRWTTPDGFPAYQWYTEEIREFIRAPWGPDLKLARVWFEGAKKEDSKPDARRHRAALAPNFIHSLDATHLRRVVNRMSSEFCCGDFAMIHDSFGVPVGHADVLWQVVREEFYRMYTECEPLKALFVEWGLPLEGLPAPGSWNIEEVLTSTYAFK